MLGIILNPFCSVYMLVFIINPLSGNITGLNGDISELQPENDKLNAITY